MSSRIPDAAFYAPIYAPMESSPSEVIHTSPEEPETDIDRFLFLLAEKMGRPLKEMVKSLQYELEGNPSLSKSWSDLNQLFQDMGNWGEPVTSESLRDIVHSFADEWQSSLQKKAESFTGR